MLYIGLYDIIELLFNKGKLRIIAKKALHRRQNEHSE